MGDFSGYFPILAYIWYGNKDNRMHNRLDGKLGAADIAARLRRDISNETLRLHDRLPPERHMAETYRVARGTIREALNRLADEGLVEIRPGSGTYIIQMPNIESTSAIRNATPLELMDTRFALEPHICRLAVLHGRRSDFEKLDTLCSRMENSAGNPVAFAEADTEFHRGLVDSTRNGLLIWIINQITEVRGQEEWTRMRHLTLHDRIIAKYSAQHRRILTAIRNRDPEQAANLMKEHLETARLSLTRAAET
jgi:DNA-binding FadR family transcriptional regulator